MSFLPIEHDELIHYKEQCESKDIWIQHLTNENEKLKAFYGYFADLYGQGLEVANWHHNGDLEAFDNFFESAEDEMNK